MVDSNIDYFLPRYFCHKHLLKLSKNTLTDHDDLYHHDHIHNTLPKAKLKDTSFQHVQGDTNLISCFIQELRLKLVKFKRYFKRKCLIMG